MHSKGNHQQKEKINYGIGQNTWEQCYQQAINLQNIQTAHGAQYQRNKNPIKKWAEDLSRLHQRRHTDGKETHENMLNMTNY